MTQLAIISAKTYSESVNNIGDIVGVFTDEHKFTEKEIALFDIIKVADTKEIIEAKIPKVKHITKSFTTEWTDEEPEHKTVWQDSNGDYMDIIINPKYKLRIDDGVISETYSKESDNLITKTVITSIDAVEPVSELESK